MPFLLYFAHYFDSHSPDLLGIFETEVDVIQAKKEKLPRSWKGELYSVEVPFGSFVTNQVYQHPLSLLQFEQ